jgi:phosphoribosyl 1,2-cyclic phosphate phosphodiesterase
MEGKMKVQILGSGGSFTIPRPGCKCVVCKEARKKGLPYSRTGPSLFVHGPNVLIDTPEEIKEQINRSNIKNIAGCFYSHWHGDHVMGRRVWWSLNYDFKHVIPQHRTTTVYLPEQVADDFHENLGSWQHLSTLEEQGMVKMVVIRDKTSVELSNVCITPFRLAEQFVYGFLFEDGERRLVVVPDDTFGWKPDKSLHGVDLVILPMGVAEFNPLTGRRRMGKHHPVLVDEATFENTLEIIRELQAKKVVLTHIEEHDGLSYDDLALVAGKLQKQGLNVQFAFDNMIVNV